MTPRRSPHLPFAETRPKIGTRFPFRFREPALDAASRPTQSSGRARRIDGMGARQDLAWALLGDGHEPASRHSNP
jgi:hypothetical protein